VIVADGLYPYQEFFDTCQQYQWHYIVTFKDGCLPSVWQEVESLHPLQPKNQRKEKRIVGTKVIDSTYRWVTDIDYNSHLVQWIECREILTEKEKTDIIKRFVYITNLKIDRQNARDIVTAGRLRWKIENEGFNTQKNQGYELKHKFARKDYRAMKNYYQCLQIAHIINQLLVLSITFQSLLTGKTTIKHIWKNLQSLMSYGTLKKSKIKKVEEESCQIRFVT
jgi:hypothetical protein